MLKGLNLLQLPMQLKHIPPHYIEADFQEYNAKAIEFYMVHTFFFGYHNYVILIIKIGYYLV